MQDTQIDLFDAPKAESFGLTPGMVDMAIKGGHCPCCKQMVKIYSRTLTVSMVKALVMIQKYFKAKPGATSCHVEGYLKRCRIGSTVRGDFAKLRYWGFLVKNTDRAGHWRFTPKARQFLAGEINVQECAVIYNNKFYGLDGKFISVSQAIKNKFNLAELMEAEIEYIG